MTLPNEKYVKTPEAFSETVIEVTNLSIRFDELQVLKDVSLSLLKGENLVILGRSGCGKSVLIRCIVGLLVPDTGTIKIMGKEVSSMNQQELSEYRRKIGFLFQRDALYDSMTVKENIEFPLVRNIKGLTAGEIKKRIESALESVGLVNVMNKMPSELSGGMRKRVSLARTLVIEPMIMLYDEPTTGLDPATTDEISSLINGIRTRYMTSSIIITHDVRSARKVSDRVIVLNEGKVCGVGKLSKLEKSGDPFIKSFFI